MDQKLLFFGEKNLQGFTYKILIENINMKLHLSSRISANGGVFINYKVSY